MMKLSITYLHDCVTPLRRASRERQALPVDNINSLMVPYRLTRVLAQFFWRCHR